MGIPKTVEWKKCCIECPKNVLARKSEAAVANMSTKAPDRSLAKNSLNSFVLRIKFSQGRVEQNKLN